MTEYSPTQVDEAFCDLRSSAFFYVWCSEVNLTLSEIQGGATQDLLIHNNLANLINSTDMNCISAMQFAVDVLQVENIVICGHYGCIGVRTVIECCRLDFLGTGCDLW